MNTLTVFYIISSLPILTFLGFATLQIKEMITEEP